MGDMHEILRGMWRGTAWDKILRSVRKTRHGLHRAKASESQSPAICNKTRSVQLGGLSSLLFWGKLADVGGAVRRGPASNHAALVLAHPIHHPSRNESSHALRYSGACSGRIAEKRRKAQKMTEPKVYRSRDKAQNHSNGPSSLPAQSPSCLVHPRAEREEHGASGYLHSSRN